MLVRCGRGSICDSFSYCIGYYFAFGTMVTVPLVSILRQKGQSPLFQSTLNSELRTLISYLTSTVSL